MPTIEQSLFSNVDTTHLKPVLQTPSVEPIQPRSGRSVFLRSPVPPIGAVSPDNLSQFEMHGAIPQYRVFIKHA